MRQSGSVCDWRTAMSPWPGRQPRPLETGPPHRRRRLSGMLICWSSFTETAMTDHTIRPEMAAPAQEGSPRPWEDELLTVDDVCAWFKVTRDWIYDEVEAGRLPFLRLG